MIQRTSSHLHSPIRLTVALFASLQQSHSRYPSLRDISKVVGGATRRVDRLPMYHTRTFLCNILAKCRSHTVTRLMEG